MKILCGAPRQRATHQGRSRPLGAAHRIGFKRYNAKLCIIPPFLPESELGQVLTAVGQPKNQQATGPRPRFGGLPDIRIGIGRRVVRQLAPARGHRFFNGGQGGAAVTGYLLRGGGAACKDGQPLIALETEFHRNGAPGLDRVKGGEVVHWGEEARKGEDQDGRRGDRHAPAPGYTADIELPIIDHIETPGAIGVGPVERGQGGRP
jgi:hypothetical protein